jgi:hypothetical protein
MTTVERLDSKHRKPTMVDKEVNHVAKPEKSSEENN